MAGNRRLGDFLRSRRTRLRPADVGLPAGRPRRTPGLLREEVAGLAGISTEWYVRLEQGRSVSPSTATIEALGDALRLGDAERRHLRSLAAAGARSPFSRETVPEPLRRVVEGLTQPAYVAGLRWDVLAWNAAAAALLIDWDEQPSEERNILAFMFADPRARALFGDGWADEAKRMASLFRATYDLWAGDPAFEALVERLRSGSPEFRGWWAEHEVATPGSGTKALHRGGGTARFEYATFQSNDDPSLKLAIYVEERGRVAAALSPASP